MFSVQGLRVLSTGQSRQFTRHFLFGKKPEPEPEPVKSRKSILPIDTYDGQGAINGYVVSLKDASKKQAVLSQLEGCEYNIMSEFSETLPCFSGKFDTKALHILRTSLDVKAIAERYPVGTNDDGEVL